MGYLFDTNTFIEAKNRYYAFDICPGFWEWMDTVATAENVASIVPVRDEMTGGSDELAEWVKQRNGAAWFLSVDDDDTQNHFGTIAQHISGQNYTEQAVAKFLAGADPWLIAKAATIGATVVTLEMPEPRARARIPIPNVCEMLSVPYMNTFQALRILEAKFRLHVD